MTGSLVRSDRRDLPLVPMPVVVLAADESFVDLDDAAKFISAARSARRGFCGTCTAPSCRSRSPSAVNLERADALLAGQHQVHDLEPLAQRLVGVLEDRAAMKREPIAVWRAFSRTANATCATAGHRQPGLPQRGQTNALRPAAGLQIGLAGIFVTEWETSSQTGLRSSDGLASAALPWRLSPSTLV